MQFPEEKHNWDVSFSPAAAKLLCEIHGLTSAFLISVLPLPLHQEIPELNGGWPGHVSAAAAAVTQTAFLGPCSPGTISAKDIRKLAQGEGGSQAEGRAGQPGEGNDFCFSATAPDHLT